MSRFYNLFAAQDQTPERRAWHGIYADYFVGRELVLDIGCGAGTFLEVLRDRDIGGKGIDFDPQMVQRCREKGLDAAVHDMRDLAGRDIHPDAIHASHVVEHLDGPAAVALLEWCAQALPPGGLLVLRTPNWGNEQVRDGGFWLDYTHVRPYPLVLLRVVLTALGMEILQSGHEPMGWQDTFVISRKPGPAKDRAVSAPDDLARRVRVRWEGSFFLHHSLAHVNREMAAALLDLEAPVDLTLWPTDPHQFSSDEDPGRYRRLAERFFRPGEGGLPVTVRHRWPPDFTRPAEGALVIVQPWEFGAMPVEWVGPMRDCVDEVWVPSAYVKACYVAGGVPADKIAVVPNGVNPAVFHLDVTPVALPVRQAFKFLSVGPLLHRKGTDLLLQAYTQEFTARDDVALILKDLGGGSPYTADRQFVDLLRKMGQESGAPEILYLAQNVTIAEMAALYRTCSCLVHPYRGEGFGLPIAEAMACGLPVIVTDAGACLDFCDQTTAFLVPAEKRVSGQSCVGQLATAGSTWWYEADVGALRQAMRWAYENRAEAQALGSRAASKIREQFTWERSAQKACERLAELAQRWQLGP